ncbi:hypothetical protein UKMH10_4896 [Burkholderia pseudomallei]|uniref:Uncharacterized protein n=1 Tax=Burkholderia pseudomallei 1710a TaxID=320371 RepID=A0A0E1VYC9_BURPE|nr:hypothetical protein BURPS1710A_A0684 [Burkholderia pseudomallei 1710a]VUD66928.1 hypothetical protein UKMH10_4896 [Burkholderia pseudomallei]
MRDRQSLRGLTDASRDAARGASPNRGAVARRRIASRARA